MLTANSYKLSINLLPKTTQKRGLYETSSSTSFVIANLKLCPWKNDSAYKNNQSKDGNDLRRNHS